MSDTGTAILGRLIAPGEPTLDPEAARAILALTFGPADRRRVLELCRRNQEGGLDAGERAELEEYLRVDDFLSLLQSKARLSLKKAGLDPDAA